MARIVAHAADTLSPVDRTMENLQDTMKCQTCAKHAVFIYSRTHTTKPKADNTPMDSTPSVVIGEERYYRCPKGHVSRVRDF